MGRTRWRTLTPSGDAAVAVIMITGRPELDLRDAKGAPCGWPQADRFHRATLRHGGEIVDDLVVVGTSDGAELHVHGGAGVLAAVIGVLEDAGCRRDDTAQDPPRPRSLRAARAWASASAGPLRDLVAEVQRGCRRGSIDPDLSGRIQLSLSLMPFARQLRRPPRVALVGRPNAGKSTLFNALLSQRRALVSPTAGTTRDAIEAELLIAEVPVRLVDTAGDARGVTADLFVHLRSAAGEPAYPGSQVLVVQGKADLMDRPSSLPAVSGATGQGLDGLIASIARQLGLDGDPELDVWVPVDPEVERLLRAADVAARDRADGDA